MNILTVDFGSTYTKLTLIDTAKAEIVGTANAFTTINTNIIHGFDIAVAKLQQNIGEFEYHRLLCCSSAGGGLKMVAIGLVPQLTAQAARLAASSAGAKVMKTYAFEMSQHEQDEIAGIHPDIVLLCGGTDGGNKEVIIANAKRLCQIEGNFTIVVAGNKCANHQIEEILQNSGKDFIITHNVMPTFNKLNIAPARNAICNVFIQKIIDAKGLTAIQQMASASIIPTPLAVMKGCELLSKGTDRTSGIGDFMAVDLGGATTDVYSMSHGLPINNNVLMKGLPEPFSKRTVEGDLGMRYSLASLIDEAGIDDTDQMDWAEKCIANPDIIASCPDEQRLDEAFAHTAVQIATERHCGYMESSYTSMGEIYTLTGKDLTHLTYIIGIGGAIINSSQPSEILKAALHNPLKPHLLKPQRAEFLLDRRYIFASMGLLSSVDSELALNLMKKEIVENRN